MRKRCVPCVVTNEWRSCPAPRTCSRSPELSSRYPLWRGNGSSRISSLEVSRMRNDRAVELINSNLCPLSGAGVDFDPLLRSIGKASYVLIGEASHGTHDFYDIRADITKRLIQEHGFLAVAVEADWPDAHRVNRYVRARGGDHSPQQALADFERFPRWMWRNRDVERFIGWLRSHNDSRPRGLPEVGFYGLDLYSMNASRAEVVRYLERVDPEAARRARERYACFDHF